MKLLIVNGMLSKSYMLGSHNVELVEGRDLVERLGSLECIM